MTSPNVHQASFRSRRWPRAGADGRVSYSWLAGALAVTAASLGIAACGSGDTGPTQDSAGADLYSANCASCHGSDLRGTDRGPSHLSIVYEPSHHGDEAFRSAVDVGSKQHHWDFGDMPPVDGLDADEVDEIIEYVRATQEEKGLEP